jgi:ABC-type polar amino acid transport system ATPase subunit
MIKVENLSKKYGDLVVLKNISTEIKKGEVVSIIGPSGTGKSTFLRCLNLLDEPSSGSIFIDGENILFHNYCDISIAVSAPKGLVVPVIRNAESLSMAEIEKTVVELAGKARDNKL